MCTVPLLSRSIAFVVTSFLLMGEISGGHRKAPPAVHATYFGGSGNEWVWDVALHTSGDLIMVGSSDSVSFGNDRLEPNHGALDVLVVRFSPLLDELVSMSVIGGIANDLPLAVDVASDGMVIVGGLTTSPDFPTTPDAFQRDHGGFSDGFVARLDMAPDTPAEERLVYASLLGGGGEDACIDLKYGRDGSVTAVGFTSSASDFPITDDAFQYRYGGGAYDAFVLQLLPDPKREPEEQLVYSTYIGGSDADAHPTSEYNRLHDQAVQLDETGKVVVVGLTMSRDFPLTPTAFDTTHNGGRDAYVVQLDPRRSPAEQLIYSTLLGGGSANEAASAVDIDDDGYIYVAGWTWDSGFPATAGALQSTLLGADDAFLAVIWPDRNRRPAEQLLYATLLGGSDVDYASDLAVVGRGRVLLTGGSRSRTFPTTHSAPDGVGSGWQAFFSMIDIDLTGPSSVAARLVYSLSLGGTDGGALSDWDNGHAIAATEDGVVYLAGPTVACDVPSISGYQRDCRGAVDALIHALAFNGRPPFRRADPDESRIVDITDAIAIFSYLFLGGATPSCLESADVQNDGAVDISDGIAILEYLFLGGPGPGPSPAACAFDPDPAGSAGDLGCEAYHGC